MEYNYDTRRKFSEKKLAAWQQEHAEKINALPTELKALYQEIFNWKNKVPYNKTAWESFWEKYNKDEALPAFMKKNCSLIVELFVPEEFITDYYAILGEIQTFTYTRGYSRRSLRTKSKYVHVDHMFALLYNYMVFGFFGVTVTDYIMNRLPEEELDYKQNTTYGDLLPIEYLDEIIAARINAGDEAVIEAVTDAFLSENNITIVTVPLVRSVIKSKNTELHTLLAKFFVAARLQEGVRQVVCENADCGRADAFLTILKAIEENDMLRFSAVKRAVATWTGLLDLEDTDRITNKILNGAKAALADTTVAKTMVESNDSIEIMTGLWSLAFYETKDAVETALRLVEKGTKNQILTVSYFNRMLQKSIMASNISKYIFEHYRNDLEMLTAYMPTYLAETESIMRNIINRLDPDYIKRFGANASQNIKEYTIQSLFENEEEARTHYEILEQASAMMKKKTLVFSPCIFPWYSVQLEQSNFIVRMVLIAYLLHDQALIDGLCMRLDDVNGTYSLRGWCVQLLLHAPETEIQRNALITYVSDKESNTRDVAYKLLKQITLTQNEYIKLESFMKYKTDTIRQNVLQLLNNQGEKEKLESAGRLFEAKDTNMRLAAYDIVKGLREKNSDKKQFYAEFVQGAVVDKESMTEQEKVLYNEICGGEGSDKVLETEGFGLYNPLVEMKIPDEIGKSSEGKKCFAYFNMTEQELDHVFLELDKLFKEHERDEYKDFTGEMVILGNGLVSIGRHADQPIEDIYPFKEMWLSFYDQHIQTEQRFWNLRMALSGGYYSSDIKDIDLFREKEDKLFVNCGSGYVRKVAEYAQTRNAYNQFMDYDLVFKIIESAKKFKLPLEICIDACQYAASLPENARWYEKPPQKYLFIEECELAFTQTSKFIKFTNRLKECETEEEFSRAFWILHLLDEKYQFQSKRSGLNYYGSYEQKNMLSVYSYMKAYQLGLIEKDSIYRYALDTLGVANSVSQLSIFMVDTFRPVELRQLDGYMPVNKKEKSLDRTHPFFKLGQKIYYNIVDMILRVELKRGDTPTIFSSAIGRINRVYGMNHLFDILVALGNDTLDRNTYYSWRSDVGKRECLSHLLQVCEPLNSDSLEMLKEGVKRYKISEERLIETAMYAPQWLDLVEKYLKCPGFKSGCYYFMAHMNERFDDKKKAMIAKYTPLSEEELNDGCFDVTWFTEIYKQLGEKLFAKLYKAAKYISDGSKHTRARKYADAALDKVTVEELEKAIIDKRNKDLLMSYGLVPSTGEKDQLHRYEFLQKFLKESKQFGAQRRASEAKCVEVALKNMATSLGYADELRLTLAMETALVAASSTYFEGVVIDAYTVKANILNNGEAEVQILKDGKKLKTIPTVLKKQEDFLTIKEFVTKLKNQRSRLIKMFEQAMENQENYSVGELRKLVQNPVAKPILDKFVYVVCGDEKLHLDLLKKILETNKDTTQLRLAHPIDLYHSGTWKTWQKYFYDMQMETGEKQPFKQVFRELYIKLPEEKDAFDSRMFAGNQIQPAKTVGALKNRRWVADYENGLQKIYYKDNIIATIYAMADWFSPADTESPTLEYVCFYDRKTFAPLRISEVPDVIYSEVMRDVDLAVSVAHAGGVDPLASHSTVEMRKVIIEFNIQLFKLDNVTVEGSHAFVKGSYGEYSIHLGSGIIHKVGGHQINVLPVHSQKRGKMFLPFVDDDPKTAEIVSKILMFAKDTTIKDPYILEQI